jgi:hypothetical protein
VSFFTPVYTVQDGSELEVYPEFAVEYRDASHRYWIHSEGARVPAVSVTSVLKVLNKPQLLKWAESRGAEGAARLAAMGELENVGTATHSVLEHWGRYEEIPNLADYQPEVRGFVQGLCGWLLKRAPKPTSTERIVGSAKHTYAGRLDMRAVIDGKDTLVDLKRKRVYTEAHLQTRGYALADVECGNPPPDDILIVAVAGDGSFQEARCEASEADWLSVLATQRAMLRLDKLARAA